MEVAEGMQHQGITAPVGTPDALQDAAQEKVLRQSEVNDLIGKAKHAAYEKGKREALEEAARSQQNASAPTQQSGGSMGGMPQLTEEQVRQMIADEAGRQAQIAAVDKTLSSFAQQMSAGKGRYSDFDETVGMLGNLQNLPHIVDMATGTGMAADVMYELGRNPGKVGNLTTLAYLNPDLAKVEMRKLADSIKANQEASESPSAKEPLSQVRPSTAGTDNGSNAIRDLRRKPWLRG